MGLDLSKKPEYSNGWNEKQKIAWEQQLRKQDPYFLLHLKKIYQQETGIQLNCVRQEAVLSEIRIQTKYDWEKIHGIYIKACSEYTHYNSF